jgi:uncharacterized protein
MTTSRFIQVIMLCCAFIGTASAQSNSEPKIQVKAIPNPENPNEVFVRWVPMNFSIWQKGNQYGYKVERQLLAENGVYVDEATRIASTYDFTEPFTPLPEDNWDLSSDIAAVAASAIYSDDFQVVAGGGSDPLSNAVNTNSVNDNRFGFGLFAADQSLKIARFMGLGVSEDGLEDKNTYSYRVSVNFPTGQGLLQGFTTVDMRVPYVMPQPNNLKATVNTSSVSLSVPRGELEQFYTSYNIERSKSPHSTFVVRNAKPLVFLSNDVDSENMIFNDSMEQTDVDYYYRIVGKSPFDVFGPPSAAVVAVRKPAPLGIYPVLVSVTEVGSSSNPATGGGGTGNGNPTIGGGTPTGGGHGNPTGGGTPTGGGHGTPTIGGGTPTSAAFLVKWTFPDQNNADISGFKIMRSLTADAGFDSLGFVSPTDREYTDNSPDPLINYYKIIAIDRNGNPMPSLNMLGQLSDLVPPAPPTGFQATVTPAGLVTLNWKPNTEADLKGYRIFYANSLDGEFSQINEEVATGTSITQQLEIKVMAKMIYYKMLATDLRENDSPYTPAIKLQRPDAIAPSKPLLTKVDPLAIGVKINWVYSPSDDVEMHKLQRRKATVMDWETLAEYPQAQLDSTMTTYIDSTILGTTNYVYRMLAADASRNTSSSPYVEVKPVRVQLDTITAFKVKFAMDGTQKQAKLNWEYTNEPLVQSFQIYRGVDGLGGKQYLYKTFTVVPSDVVVDPVRQKALHIWKDIEVNENTPYVYRVLAKYADGSSCPLSAPMEFSF